MTTTAGDDEQGKLRCAFQRFVELILAVQRDASPQFSQCAFGQTVIWCGPKFPVSKGRTDEGATCMGYVRSFNVQRL